MSLIDEEYTRHPFYGTPRMTAWLKRQGYDINRKRIVRLMNIMGLQAVYPKPRLSMPAKEHKKYPYLLKGLKIDRPDQVWSADITYIRMFCGFVYLVAIMDWFSRYVLAHEISITLEKRFCINTLENALNHARPEIFNTDQGCQFTSPEFTGILLSSGVSISMDGRGRFHDNIFVERLWRSVKYEEVYLKEYRTVKNAIDGISKYFDFYNNERPHQSLGNKTPAEVYHKKGLSHHRIPVDDSESGVVAAPSPTIHPFSPALGSLPSAAPSSGQRDELLKKRSERKKETTTLIRI